MIFKTKYARILGTNSKKPITSVINPGVSKKHPDIKIKIPLIKGLKGFPIFPLNWFFNSNMTPSPCFLTVKAPSTAVKKIKKTVIGSPNIWFILINTTISRIGTNRNKKKNFI